MVTSSVLLWSFRKLKEICKSFVGKIERYLLYHINMVLGVFFLGEWNSGLDVLRVLALLLTALPGAIPLLSALNHRRVMYPVSDYVLRVAAVAALLLSAAVWSTDGTLGETFTQEFADPWIAVMVLLLFCGLYRLGLDVAAKRVLAFAAGGCYSGYLLSHLLDAWHSGCVSEWHIPKKYGDIFVLVAIFIFLMSILEGHVLQRMSERLLYRGKEAAR